MGLIEKFKNWIGAKARPGSFLRSTAILSGGAATGSLITVLASPIISRIYPKDQVGTLLLFATVLSCIAPIASLRYETALAVPKDDRKAAQLLLACLGSTVTIASLTLIAVALFGEKFAKFCNNPVASRYFWLLPISLLGIGAYQTFSTFAIRHREFGLTARTRVVQSLAQATCQLGLGFARLGPIGLVLGDVLGRVGGAWTISSLAWKNHRETFKGLRFADVVGAAKEYAVFPKVSVPATILHTATTNFTLILGPMYGKPDFDAYFFGIKFLWGPVSLVGQAMAQVYLGEASRWARDDPAHMLRSFDQIVKRLAYIGIFPFGVLTAFGAPITAFVFGKQWYEAGVLVQIQAVSWWAMFVVGPVIATLNILGKQKWQLWADAAGVALMSAGFFASHEYGWSARVAVGLYSVAIILMYGWLYLACRRSIVHAVRLRASFDQVPNSES